MIHVIVFDRWALLSSSSQLLPINDSTSPPSPPRAGLVTDTTGLLVCQQQTYSSCHLYGVTRCRRHRGHVTTTRTTTKFQVVPHCDAHVWHIDRHHRHRCRLWFRYQRCAISHHVTDAFITTGSRIDKTRLKCMIPARVCDKWWFVDLWKICLYFFCAFNVRNLIWNPLLVIHQM